MEQVDSSVRNLIFDLGGVIIDLAVEQIVADFSRLVDRSTSEIEHAYVHHPVFMQYEKGLISSEEFRSSLRSIFLMEATDEELDRCWNAMILGLPSSRLTMLTQLKDHFNTAVLSNTNEIHMDYVNRVVLKGDNLDAYFHASHYSHLMNKRKPEPEIYEEVLALNNFSAQSTVFMDDNVNNLKAAEALGIHTIHIKHSSDVLSLFKAYV